MDKKDIAKYSDVSASKAPKLELPEVRLDGRAGEFVFVETKDKDYNKTTIGSLPIKVNILKIRKRLVDFNSGYTTTEHVSSRDEIVLFKPKDPNDRKRGVDVERGISSDIRTKYKNLKTEQIVYSIYDGKLVRLIVKGGSLGTPNDPNGSGFYDYLSSFDEDRHAWEYETVITPVKKKNGAVSYTAMTFAKGAELDASQLDLTGDNMKLLYEFFQKVDAYEAQMRKKNLKEVDSNQEIDVPSSDDVPTIQVDGEPNGDIDPKDLPF